MMGKQKVYNCIYCARPVVDWQASCHCMWRVWGVAASQVPIAYAKTKAQMISDRVADRHLCFHYTDITIPLLPKY